MALPGVVINIQENGVGGQDVILDGVAGMILSGVAVSGKIALNDPKQLFSLDDAVALGLDAAYDTSNSTKVYKHIKDFYAEAGKGAMLYIMIVANTVVMTDMVDLSKPTLATKLLNFAKSASAPIKLLVIGRTPPNTYTPTLVAGYDDDADNAITTGQALAVQYQAAFFPFHLFVEGRAFTGTVSSLKNQRASTNKYVSVVLVNNEASNGACIGKVLGRHAAIPVQRDCGRVKDGARFATEPYLSNAALISTVGDAAIGVMHDKGYIVARQHVNQNGWFFNFGNNCTGLSSDFNSVERVRTIEKARLVVIGKLTEILLDDERLNKDITTGNLVPADVLDIEHDINLTLEAQMTSKGNCEGASCSIPLSQDITAQGYLAVNFNVVPKNTVQAISGTLQYSLTLN